MGEPIVKNQWGNVIVVSDPTFWHTSDDWTQVQDPSSGRMRMIVNTERLKFPLSRVVMGMESPDAQ